MRIAALPKIEAQTLTVSGRKNLEQKAKVTRLRGVVLSLAASGVTHLTATGDSITSPPTCAIASKVTGGQNSPLSPSGLSIG